MKKIITACAVALLSVSSVSAMDSFDKEIGLSVGVGEHDVVTGMGLEIKAYQPLSNGFSIGVGMDVDIREVEISDGVEETGALIDVFPTVKYDINDKVNVSAMVGYTMGTIDSNDINTVTYGTGAMYKLDDKISVGVSYKYTELDTNGGDIDLNRFDFHVTHTF